MVGHVSETGRESGPRLVFKIEVSPRSDSFILGLEGILAPTYRSWLGRRPRGFEVRPSRPALTRGQRHNARSSSHERDDEAYHPDMRLVRLLAVVGLVVMILPAASASSSSGAPLPPACASDHLMVLASDTDGLAGTGLMAIGIANMGATCRIGGYPEVEFFNAKGVAIDRRDFHDSSMAFAEPRSKTVTLRHEGSASIGVSWSDNSVTLLDGHNTTCPRTASLTVTLAHGVGHLSGILYVSTSPCGGGVDVTPIESGAWPQQVT